MKAKGKEKVFEVVNGAAILLILILVSYPLIYVISASVSDPNAVAGGRMWLWPVGFTLEGYQRVFREKEIWTGYANTLYYTVTGTAISVILTMVCAYPLSRRDFKARNAFTVFFTVTMFFGGGLIPTYMVIKSLKMLNTGWAILIPGCISMWNVIIARTFMQGIPFELQEAAGVDGCSHIRMFLKIMLPLSKPVIAVLALYYGVGLWNNYFSALIYLSDRKKYPLQLILREILVQQQMSSAMIRTGSDLASIAEQAKLAEMIKYSTMIVSSLPVLILYPFLQRFFEKGVMVGAIKA